MSQRVGRASQDYIQKSGHGINSRGVLRNAMSSIYNSIPLTHSEDYNR
jgi:hypothetical protein